MDKIEEIILSIAETQSEKVILSILKDSIENYLRDDCEKNKFMLDMVMMLYMTKKCLEEESSGDIINDYEKFKKFKNLYNFKDKES